MSRHGFYNANQFRAFPFIAAMHRPFNDELAAPAALPTALIVDAGVMLDIDAEAFLSIAPEVVYKVYLYQIRRSGSELEFELRSDAPGTASHRLIFTRDLSDPEFTVSYAESVGDGGSESSDSLECRATSVWEGFLVTGDLSALTLADGDSLTFDDTDWQLEPARVQTLSYLRSVTLANYDRTRATPTDSCCSEASLNCDPGEYEIYLGVRCLDGPLRFKEGYNIDIRQEDAANRIVIGAAAGGGVGRGCDMPPVFPGETVPDGSKLLGGGPACDELITGINGVGGRVVTITPGDGVTITPEANALRIAIDLTQFTGVCDVSESSNG